MLTPQHERRSNGDGNEYASAVRAPAAACPSHLDSKITRCAGRPPRPTRNGHGIRAQHDSTNAKTRARGALAAIRSGGARCIELYDNNAAIYLNERGYPDMHRYAA